MGMKQRPGCRYRQRAGLLQSREQTLQTIERSGAVERMNVYYQRAFTMLTTPRARQAFDLSRELNRLRDRYAGTWWASRPLTRHLLEAGVPVITAYAPIDHIKKVSWDTHQNDFPLLKETLPPPSDQSLSALLKDMQQRGILSKTLVIWMREFGRTPKICYTQSNNTSNATGRDHHLYCYTILLASASVKGGSYYGQSDKDCWYPAKNPIHPGDTLFDASGIDPH